MIRRGYTAAQISQRIARMRCEVSQSSMYAIGSRRRMQCLLAGYVQCEIEDRTNQEISEPKRRRLLGKQSDAIVHFRLPWFSQFAKHHGLHRHRLLPHILALQECLQRSPYLQECIQGALMKCLEDPEPAHLSKREIDSQAATDYTHDNHLSGSNGNCNGNMGISYDEAGDVWVSIPRGQQPHVARGQQLHAKDHNAGMAETRAVFAAAAEEAWGPPKEVVGYDMAKKELDHETHLHAGSQVGAKLEPRHLETPLQGVKSDERNKGKVEQFHSEGQSAEQLEAQMWSWTADLFAGDDPEPGLPSTGPIVWEVD